METAGLYRYEISKEELKKVQAVQQELIGEVARICKKCGIHFCMVGGTMLGAVRHSGPIPWDDDADIGFLREEYEKFREACRTQLNHEKYYMQDLRDTPGYRWGYGKLRRRGTEFIRMGQEFMPYEQGIFIDLMPFDSVPDHPVGAWLHCLCCFAHRKVLWAEVGKRTEKRMWKRILYRLAGLIPLKTVSGSYQRLVEKGLGKKTRRVRILTFPTPQGVYGYDRSWYTRLCLYRFGEFRLPGAKDYDGYLQTKYGDYMELPPVEKRGAHPVSKLKLPEE